MAYVKISAGNGEIAKMKSVWRINHQRQWRNQRINGNEKIVSKQQRKHERRSVIVKT